MIATARDEQEPYQISSSSDDEDFARVSVNTTIGIYTHATHHRSGLFSTVYKARTPTTPSTLVALKVTTPSLTSPPHDSIREARILESLPPNLSVVPLLSTFTSGPKFTLVFPFIPLDLAHLLNTRRALSPTATRSILHDLFAALAHVHAYGLIHRDVKPANILLASPHGPACLADFGIAWSPSDSASEPAARKITDVGTTCYRAPELLFGQRAYSQAIDLWAAGCVAAEALSPARAQLFDAGELGSELALIQSMFVKLGTPDGESWPEARRLPDWGKMEFRRFEGMGWAELLPGVGEQGRKLVGGLIRFESADRCTAQEVLRCGYFEGGGV